MLSIYSDSIEGQLYSKAFHMNKKYIYIYVCVCDSWGGRSVLGKTVPEVLNNDQGIQTNLGWWITFLFFILIFLDKKKQNKTKQKQKKTKHLYLLQNSNFSKPVALPLSHISFAFTLARRLVAHRSIRSTNITITFYPQTNK